MSHGNGQVTEREGSRGTKAWVRAAVVVVLAALGWWALVAKYPHYKRVDPITRNEERISNPEGKDYWHYFVAAEAMVEGRDIYESGIKYYIYPPMTAVLFIPLLGMGWMAGSKVFYVLMAGCVAASLVVLSKDLLKRFGMGCGRNREEGGGEVKTRLGEPGCSKQARLGACETWGVGGELGWMIAGASLVGLIAASDSCRRAMSMIQTDPIILLCLVMGLVWYGKRPTLCGVVLGLATNIKYHAVIFLPYLLLRGQWRAAGAYAASAIGFAILPAAIVGWDRNVGYWERALGELGYAGGVNAAARSGTYPITWEGSVSIPSAIARGIEAAGVSNELRAVVLIGVTGVLALMVAAGVWWMYRRQGIGLLARTIDSQSEARLVALEWAGLIVATLVFSPQTTKRHMLTMAVLGCVAGVLMMKGMRARGPGGTSGRAGEGDVGGDGIGVKRLAIGLGVLLMGMYFPPRVRESETMMGLVGAWNALSVASWCLLGFLLIVLWEGLRCVRWDRGEGRG